LLQRGAPGAPRMSVQVGTWAAIGRPFRYAAIATLALLLFGGWGYLYVKARAVDLTVATDVLASLRELKEVDARWNDWMIGTRLAGGTDGAARRASVDPTRLAKVHAQLALKVQDLGNPLSSPTLLALKETFEAKAKAVEAFAGASTAYLQTVGELKRAHDSFAAAARERASGIPPAVARDAERVYDAVLAYLAQPTPAAAKGAEGAIAELAAVDVPDLARPEVERIVAAARRTVADKAAEDTHFRSAYFASTGPRLDTAMRAFEGGFGDSLADAERFRMYLLVYSGLLLLLAAWLAWRLTANYRVISGLNRKLREANEFLEHRVEERTRDLKNAMAQLKEQETLLIQSEKMSSLGQMVAGVAHEVNTPLAYVKASLETVKGSMPKVAQALAASEKLIGMLHSENVSEAELSAQFASASQALNEAHSGGTFPDIDALVKDGLYGIGQIAELVTNLKNFSRLDRSKVAEFDLNEGIASALTIAKNQLKHRKVNKLLGAIPKVPCAPSQMNQVFLNLLTNAAQATAEEGGVITVRTYQPDPGRVAIEIADNGHGIPADVLPKIFDPFFTTKEVGKGTGLGLSITYKIVESHGGRIEVASKVGTGTKFTVTLPVKPVVVAEAA
jgi:signal transduction histidine kinase